MFGFGWRCWVTNKAQTVSRRGQPVLVISFQEYRICSWGSWRALCSIHLNTYVLPYVDRAIVVTCSIQHLNACFKCQEKIVFAFLWIPCQCVIPQHLVSSPSLISHHPSPVRERQEHWCSRTRTDSLSTDSLQYTSDNTLDGAESQ